MEATMTFRLHFAAHHAGLDWRRLGALPITEGPAAGGAGPSLMTAASGADDEPGSPRDDPHNPAVPREGRDDDAGIDRAVREAIAPVLDAGAGRVSIAVRQAHVTLEGKVPTDALREAIGRAAAQCPAVAGVDNRLAVEPIGGASVVLTPERRTVTHSDAPGSTPAPGKRERGRG
ncbi:BON domain-containing protein [Burkholderia gladioli]|uniref:BON domain-containing protein n=1 Tax=Burkholderia gladioli TaxID=28095 RepID=UPI001640CB4B|nr:BON domain-containing protein [Burkholderia gladioli]